MILTGGPSAWKKQMKKDELMKLLRNPAEYRKKKQQAAAQAAVPSAAQVQARAEKKRQDTVLLVVGIGIVCLTLITLAFYLSAKNRAENLVAALDPDQLQGLALKDKEFNPNMGVTVINVQEGHDRSVAVTQLGSTLPVISRFNYKTFTPQSFEVVGAAPWALTMNFSSNLTDPDLMRYLLANDKLIEAFLHRPDVEPLLTDPQMLVAFASDEKMLNEFFESDVVKNVLSNEKMVQAISVSRWMSYLLISASGKYFRKHPQEAVAVIASSPSLQKFRTNPYVRTAIQNNRYLKDIAQTVLGTQPQAEKRQTITAQPAGKKSAGGSSKKK